jgi:hypothetical protein
MLLTDAGASLSVDGVVFDISAGARKSPEKGLDRRPLFFAITPFSNVRVCGYA